MRQGEDFCIYSIWGAISVSRGKFLQVGIYKIFELIPKIKTRFATSEPICLMHFRLCFMKKVIKHDMGLMM